MAESGIRVTLPEPKHRTASADEYHIVGPEHFPLAHTSRLLIVALEPMDTYPYYTDTDQESVEVIEGGTAGDPQRTDDEGVYVINITLDRPLQQGEQTVLTHRTTFNYPVLPPPRFRRAVGKNGMNYLGMRVVFDAAKPPTDIWRARWDGYGSQAQIVPGSQEVEELRPIGDGTSPDPSPGVSWDMTRPEPGVYGFFWRW